MIEKLKTINPYDETEIDMETDSVGGMVYENTPLIQKVNELVDAVNELKQALGIAVDALKSAHEYYQNCVIREKQPQEINWYCTAMNMDNDISEALKEITAIEQKDK